MAKVKTKKAVKNTDYDVVMALHPDLPYEDAEEDAKAAELAAKENTPSIADLQAQVAALNAQLSSRNTDYVAATSQAVKPLPPKRMTKVDTTNLPDPSVEPEKYAEEVTKRTEEYLASQKAYADWEQAEQNTSNNRANALWAQFQEKYPQYADKFDQVEFVATKVAREAASRGLDLDKYMYGHADKFMADVDERLKKTFATEDADDDSSDDDDADTRTVGMFGGSEGGQKPTKGAGPDLDPFKAVREFQLRTGFHN